MYKSFSLCQSPSLAQVKVEEAKRELVSFEYKNMLGVGVFCFQLKRFP